MTWAGCLVVLASLLLPLCQSAKAPRLPFPPIKSDLAKGYMLNLPEELFQILEEDGRKLESFDSRSHVHGKKTTYQFPVRRKREPRFSIEQFALKVAAPIDFPDGIPKSVVAFEYWVQRRAHTEEIGFHYDKDEAHASTKQQMVFPSLATVTYLSNIGAPTLILNQTTDQYGNAEVPAIPSNGVLSYPVRGKHIWFHGKAQHGVNPNMNVGGKGERFTLLINWWSKVPDPPNCIYLSDKDISQLGFQSISADQLSSWSPAQSSLIEPTDVAIPPVDSTSEYKIVLPPNDVLTIRLPLIDTSSSSVWQFQLPRTHVGLLSELDPNKGTQRAHIHHSTNLIAYAFITPESRAHMTRILHPIQWDLYHDGLVQKNIEIYLADAVRCKDTMAAYNVNKNKLPQIVLVDKQKDKRWTLDGPHTDKSVRTFFEEHLTARGHKISLKSEL